MQKSYLFKKRGFTPIEILVVIAIIGILASIVLVSVTSVRAKVKIARANLDVKNIEKALTYFYDQYGDYPWSYSGDPNYFFFSRETGDPFLTTPDGDHYLADFYKSDWNGFNADYFTQNGYFYVFLCDDSGDNKIDCGAVQLIANDWVYGLKFILSDYCGCADWYGGEYPFQINPW